MIEKLKTYLLVALAGFMALLWAMLSHEKSAANRAKAALLLKQLDDKQKESDAMVEEARKVFEDSLAKYKTYGWPEDKNE